MENENKIKSHVCYYNGPWQVGSMGFDSFDYYTSCGKTIDGDDLPSGDFCPYCGGKRIITKNSGSGPRHIKP